MASDSVFNSLNPRHKRVVVLYTSEGRKDTYLNRISSYKACYSNNQSAKSIETAAHRLFARKDINDAIKECLPSNAYDALVLRNEYKWWYDTCKKEYEETSDENSRKAALAVLKEMSVHEGMTQKKTITDQQVKATEGYEKHAEEAKRLWREQMEKMNNAKVS